MKTLFKTLIIVGLLVFMFGVDFVEEIPPKVALVREAEAIIGMPLTPMSYAGVARRTTRRVVATETAVVATTAAAATAATATAAAASATAAAAAAAAPKPPPPPPPAQVVVVAPPPAAPAASAVPIGTVVPALPAGCTSVVVNGVGYSDCGGAFYKAAFSGNNLVYVVVPRPMQ